VRADLKGRSRNMKQELLRQEMMVIRFEMVVISMENCGIIQNAYMRCGNMRKEEIPRCLPIFYSC
jgi:hypothetical protein